MDMNNEWIKRFDNIYQNDSLSSKAERQSLIHFITALLDSERAKIREEMEDWLRSEIEKLEAEMKEYVWDNGECSICGYDSIYNEGEEHRCEVFNDSLTSIITRYKEELKVLESKI